MTLASKDHDLIEKSNRALGRLDGVTMLLPDVSLFLYFYVRKEAVLSSQIEGTQSSFSDLLLHEEALAPGVPLDDVQEVSNYVQGEAWRVAYRFTGDAAEAEDLAQDAFLKVLDAAPRYRPWP